MVSFPVPQNFVYNTFKGIRTRNGVNVGGAISATVCQNVDFVPSEVNAEIHIRSTLGNLLVKEYPDFMMIKGFESIQDGVSHCLIYVENELKGMLLEYRPLLGIFNILIDNLSKTGEANGITMNDTAFDVFVFTNGVDYYSVNFAVSPVYQVISPVYNDEPVTGLALAERAGSLVIGSNKLGLVIGSRQGDIYDWDYAVTADDKTKPWYQLFGKGVTAVIPYIDGLLVFTKDDSTLLSGNPADVTEFSRSEASIGGCMSFESWCYHDKYLFFYDNEQQNIYYYMQNNIGQKVLGEPIAPEVQKYFGNVTRLQMVSFVGDNRSEIWLLSNDFKLIYDYYVGEWTERVCQEITSYFNFDNDFYSTTKDGRLLKEKVSGEDEFFCNFDGEFYPSKYEMQTINLNSYSNMKEMEMQPIFTVTQNFSNTFLLTSIINGKKVKQKKIKMFSNSGIWGDNTNPEIIPSNQMWDVAEFATDDDSVTKQVKGKFIPNWFYVKFIIETTEIGEDFNILAFELKGLTEDTDTVGRK